MRGRQRPRVTLTASIVGLIALSVAVLTVIQNDDPPQGTESTRTSDEALAGPHSPAPGALDGRLLISRGDRCTIQEIDLEHVRIHRDSSARGCQLWVSPTGELALVRSIVASGGTASHALLAVNDELAPAASQPQALNVPGRWRASPAWSPSGTKLALCRQDGRTLVVDVQSDNTHVLEGCWPTFTPSGTVLSMSDPALDTRTAPEPSVPIPSLDVGRPLLSTVRQFILEDGQVRLDLTAVRAALPETARSLGRILGFAADGDGRLAVTVLYLDGLEVRSALQIWDGESLISSVEIPVLLGDHAHLELSAEPVLTPVQTLSFGPNDEELAIAAGSVSRELLVLDVQAGARVLGSDAQVAFDWSPSGDWLGVATESEIEIYGPERSRTPTFTLPVSVSALAWNAR